MISHDGDFLMRLSQTEHSLHEIIAMLSEYPGDAHDEVFLQRAADGFFPFPLGLSVHVERMHRIVHFVRLVTVVAKNVISADVDHLRVDSSARFRDIGCAVHVHIPAFIRLVFRLIHRRIGRTVNDRVRAIGLDKTHYRFPVCNIQLFRACTATLYIPLF